MNSYINAKKKNLFISRTIYVIFVLAVFSDILRIPGTIVTFFRLSLPVAVVIIAWYPYWFKRFVVLLSGILGVSIIQYIIFYKVIHLELSPVYSHFAQTFFLYVCIIIIFFLVKILQINNPEGFSKEIARFIIGTGTVLSFISLLNLIIPNFFDGVMLDNPNNYGCYIAAMLPFLLVKVKEERRPQDGVVLILALGIITANDAKAALFGIVIEIGIFGAFLIAGQGKLKTLRYRREIVVMLFLGIIGVILIDPSIHGYSVREITLEPIGRILRNEPYLTYTASVSFRTNTFIYAFWEIIKTGALGIGMGNTGVLLKSVFPNLNPEYKSALNASTLSLHNSWLEFALDIGMAAIVLYILIIKYALKLFFRKEQLTQSEEVSVMYILSFPVWSLGPSGIYTAYFLIITMAVLIFSDKDKSLF